MPTWGLNQGVSQALGQQQPQRGPFDQMKLATPFGAGGVGGGMLSSPQWLINQGRNAGVFSPYGSPAALDAIRMQYERQFGPAAGAARQRAQIAAGNDPALAAWAGLNAGMQGQSEEANALSDAWLKSILGNQQFLQQGVYQPYWQNQYALQQLQEMGKQQQDLQSQGFMGQMLGGLGSLGGSMLMGGIPGLFGAGAGAGYNPFLLGSPLPPVPF